MQLHKIELSTKQLALIKYVLLQQQDNLKEAVVIYTQDNEIETAKAFAEDLRESEVLIEFIDELIKE